MFQIEKVLCNKFDWGLRDEIHALVAALEVLSLAAMIAKTQKMETILQEKNKGQDREKMKREIFIHHHRQIVKNQKIKASLY